MEFELLISAMTVIRNSPMNRFGIIYLKNLSMVGKAVTLILTFMYKRVWRQLIIRRSTEPVGLWIKLPGQKKWSAAISAAVELQIQNRITNQGGSTATFLSDFECLFLLDQTFLICCG